MTWRGVDPTTDLDNLIAAYFADQKILAASTARLLAEHKPIPKTRLAGYDGRLVDWLMEMLNYGPPDGPERAWPILLQLLAQAPDDEVLTFLGCGPIEDLVNNAGAEFQQRIIERATTDPRFHRALRHVWYRDDVPQPLQELIVACRLSERQ